MTVESTKPADTGGTPISPDLSAAVAPTPPESPAKDLESKEVQRAYELVAIGDLHGNLDIFEASLKSLGLVEAGANLRDLNTLKWVGGNRKLVLLGDILADRQMEGSLILAATRVLKAQAEAANGKIVLIAGNHEDFAISFLVGKKVASVTRNENINSLESKNDALMVCLAPMFNRQGRGLMELIQKYSDYIPKTEKAIGEKFNNLADAGDYLGMAAMDTEVQSLGKEVLENMRKSPLGREILEQICQMKLVEVDGDTMFIHTELTLEILGELEGNESLEIIADSINRPFQMGLGKLLLDEGEMPERQEFYRLVNIFLDSDNRSVKTPSDEQISKYPEKFEALRKKGVKIFVHGHTDNAAGVRSEIGGVEIVNIDTSAGKDNVITDQRSIFALAKDGKIEVGKDVQLDTLKLPPMAETVKNWLIDIFSLTDAIPDTVAEDLADKFGSISVDELRAKLEDVDLKETLAYLAIRIKATERLELKADDIHRIVNFYNEWLKPEIVKGAKISDLLQEMAKYDLKATEIPAEWRKRHVDKKTAEEAALASDKEKAETISDSEKQIREIIVQYLCYGDIEEDLPESSRGEIKQIIDKAQRGMADASYKHYATSLLEIQNLPQGPEKLHKLSKHIRDSLKGLMAKINLPMSAFSVSKSWSYWDISKQYYLAKNPEKSGVGYELGNPLENEVISQQIIDRHFGWEIYGKWNSSPQYKVILQKFLDPKSLNSTKIVELLGKPGNKSNTLSSKDLVELGKLVREALFAEKKEDLRLLPVDGKFDLSKSPALDETLLLSDQLETLYKEVEKKLSYLFADLSEDELKIIRDNLYKLKEESSPKFGKLINLFYKYQREIRLLFSGELGGIRVLNLSNMKSGNKAFISAPNVMSATKLGTDGEPKAFTNLLKLFSKGKIEELKLLLDTLNGQDVSALRRLFNGAKGVFNWLESL